MQKMSLIPYYLLLYQADRAQKYMFDAPAGGGKTFIQRTIMAEIRGPGTNVHSAVAYSGITASLIEREQTLHSEFKFSINICELTVVLPITPNSPHTTRIRLDKF